MSQSDPAAKKTIAHLERAQRRHRERAEKVENARVKLDRQRKKLAESEVVLAALEAQLAEPRQQHAGDHSSADGKLQEAMLLFNPTSGRHREENAERLAQVVSSLRVHGVRARVEVKTSGKAARAQAAGFVHEGGKLLIVAAGDGTIGDVAAELIGTNTVLGIVPIGTMNNLARSLGVPLDIESACALIGMGATRTIDAGRVHSEESAEEAYFFDCAGVGLLAVAAVAGQAFEKRAWHALPKAIRSFFEAKLGTVEVELDGHLVAAHSCMVTVSNAPLMGNKLLCAADAKMDDGYLDVSVYDGMGKVALADHFLAAAGGEAGDVPSYRARHIRISADRALPSSSDMNILATRHVVEITVVPQAVQVIVGNGIGLTTPVAAAPDAPPFAPDPPFVAPLSGPTAPARPSLEG